MRFNEKNIPSRIIVGFSKEISNRIESIYKYNQGNEALIQWSEYLATIRKYISNPSIAFDYKHSSVHFRNGAILLKDFGCDAIYYIKTNGNHPPYVYIFKINLKTDEYGLKVPPTLQEGKSVVRLTESDLRFIVTECARKIVENTYSKRMHINTNKPYRTNLRNII